MGFFKRFLSLGSIGTKKSKKDKKKVTKPATVKVDSEGRIVQGDAPHQTDAEVNRLLRSASARFAAHDDDAPFRDTLAPPLPNSAHRLSSTRSVSPTPSTATSMQRRGTYVVKVHERQLHSRTEFPNANPPLPPHDDPTTPEDDRTKRSRRRDVPYTPREQNRLLTLRRDPSVASLLNMYDENGCLDSFVFSNTPENPPPSQVGRMQTQRTGSTLHQLLGEPEEDPRHAGTTEGDISWAERFLRERLDSNSSTSSLGLQTPEDLTFPQRYLDPTLPDLSAELSRENPAISSLEVELSANSETDIKIAIPAEQKTPQRASEVFGFLTERRKTMRQRTVSTLPSLMSDAASSRSKLLPPTPETSRSSPISIDDRSHWADAQIHTATIAKLSTAPAMFKRTASPLIETCPIDNDPENPFLEARDAYAYTRPASPVEKSRVQPTRIPRGPRPRSGQELSERDADSVSTRSYSRPASAISRVTSNSAHMETHLHPTEPLRAPSRASTTASHRLEPSSDSQYDAQRKLSKPRSHVPRRTEASEDKENSAELVLPARDAKARPELDAVLPVTPLRTRSIFEARYPNYVDGVPLSPASSSELSPVAQDMMSLLRKERMRARETHRRTGRVPKGTWDGE